MSGSKKKRSRPVAKQQQIIAKQDRARDQAAAMDNNSWNEAYSNFVAQLSNDLRYYLLGKPTLQVGRRLEESNSTQPSGGSCHTWDCSGCPEKGATCSSVWGVKQEDIGWNKYFVPYNSLMYTTACCSTDSKGNSDCKRETVAVIKENPPPDWPDFVSPSNRGICPYGGFDPMIAKVTFMQADPKGGPGYSIGCFPLVGEFVGRKPVLVVTNRHGNPKAQCEAHEYLYAGVGAVAGAVGLGCAVRFFSRKSSKQLGENHTERLLDKGSSAPASL